MTGSFDRRSFLRSAAAAGAAVGLGTAPDRLSLAAEDEKTLFKISLAEWSLHRTLFDKKMDNLDFPAFAKQEFGIDAVEYVNQFFKDKAKDTAYLTDLKKRADDNGVTNVLIMIDGEGALGDPRRRRSGRRRSRTITSGSRRPSSWVAIRFASTPIPKVRTTSR